MGCNPYFQWLRETGGPSLFLGVTDQASLSQGVLNSCEDFLVGVFCFFFLGFSSVLAF